MQTWNEAPKKEEVLAAVNSFFELLASGKKEEAMNMVSFSGDWKELLHSLWEDIEEWHEDFEDPSFEGAWLTNLTPPSQVSQNDLLAPCWTYHEEDDQYREEHVAEEGEHLLINVFFLDEPTDDTAEFAVTKTESGYQLELVNIHMM